MASDGGFHCPCAREMLEDDKFNGMIVCLLDA